MKHGTLLERFNENYSICKDTGCWDWTGCFAVSGYGRMMFNYQNYRAHRLSYILHNGEIPDEMIICHKCDNKKCVNPEHLFIGTILDNVKDRVQKGRTARNEKSGNMKLTNKQVKQIRKRKMSLSMMAKKYNVAESTIVRIVTNVTRKIV